MTIELIIAIIGSVGGATGIVELIKYFTTRKAQQRKAESNADLVSVNVDTEEWHLWRDQLDRMNNQIEKKDERIEKLNDQLAEKEVRFKQQIENNIEKTKRLRDCQDREYKANIDNQRLSEQITVMTEEIGGLKLFIEEQQCRKKKCPYRMPQNAHTRNAIVELGLCIETDEIPVEDPESINLHKNENNSVR